MKTIILYSSKTGYTENYAKWIAKALGCDIQRLADFDIKNLSAYNTIVYGGGLYAGGINGFKKISPFLENANDKKLVLFATGASPMKSVDKSALISHNMSPTISDRVMFFYLRGGYDFNRLSFIDKILMTIFKFKIRFYSKKRALTADENGMLNAYNQPVDFTKEDHITPIVEHIRQLENS